MWQSQRLKRNWEEGISCNNERSETGRTWSGNGRHRIEIRRKETRRGEKREKAS
jgi:hypothetical protein